MIKNVDFFVSIKTIVCLELYKTVSAHHLIHVYQLVSAVFPAGQSALGQTNHVGLHAEASVLRQSSEEDVLPHGPVLKLRRGETFHELLLDKQIPQIKKKSILNKVSNTFVKICLSNT